MAEELTFKLNRDEAAMLYSGLALLTQVSVLDKKHVSFVSLTDALAGVKEQCDEQNFDVKAHILMRAAEHQTK